MSNNVDTEVIVERLTCSQSRMYAYIYSLTHNADVAWDLLQETNRVLWARADQYVVDLEFLPWALTHAFNQVRTWRKKQQREKLYFQDESTLLEVEESIKQRAVDRSDERTVALEHCIQTLGEQQQKLVRRVYHDGATLSEVARDQSTRANTLAVSLHRIRQTLAECIRRRTEP